MIDSIVGIVEEVYGNHIILNYNSIYFRIFCNTSLFIDKIGKEVRVFICIKLNEAISEFECYGFLDREERELFLKLQKISGIGAKVAFYMLNSVPYQQLIIDIATGNQAKLEKIKGIGKKTAGRIILELKESLKKELQTVDPKKTNFNDSKAEEIFLALMSLGFRSEEIGRVIDEMDVCELSIEECIKLALKKLSKI